MNKTYIDIGTKLVAFEDLPCGKCRWRYSLHCPRCNWNADGQFNTYGGKIMSIEAAEMINKRRKENENR